jgi:hypothetical protein
MDHKIEKINDTHWVVTVVEDPETGELVLPFPPDALAQVGWDFGDTLIWDTHKDGSITLHKKDDTKQES